MSLHALLRKQLLRTLGPDLPLTLLSLTVLVVVSVPSSEHPLYVHRLCGVFLLLCLLLPELSLVSY